MDGTVTFTRSLSSFFSTRNREDSVRNSTPPSNSASPRTIPLMLAPQPIMARLLSIPSISVIHQRWLTLSVARKSWLSQGA